MKKELIKTLSVISTDGVEYNVFIEKYVNNPGKEYSIYSSHSHLWTEGHRDVLLFTVVNTGNGLKFKKPKGKYSNYGYDESLYLSILLNIDRKLQATSDSLIIVEAPSGEPFIKI